MKRYFVITTAALLIVCCLCAAAMAAIHTRTLRGLEAMTAAMTGDNGEAYFNALLSASPAKEAAEEGRAVAEAQWHTRYPIRLFVEKIWSDKLLCLVGAAFAAVAAAAVIFAVSERKRRVKYEQKLNSRVNAALRGEAPFRAESEDERLAEKLLAEIDRLKELRETSAEELHQYVENVAHELKTPASGLLLSLDLMEKNGMTGEKLAAARGCAMRIGAYVSGLLSLARLRADKVRFTFEPFDMNELVNEIADELKANGVELEVSGSGAVVNGDRVRIKEALVNLIMNAAKHSKSDSKVKVELTRSALDSAVIIRDGGKGPAPAAIERYAVGSEDGTSSGIGLSLAQAVAKRHSGRLIISSGENGSETGIRIPVFDLKQSI